MKAVAVVPAYQEEDILSETVSTLLALEGVERVLVVDDASTDNSATAARTAGATVVVHNRNLGKGRSLNRVLPELDFECLLLIDGDLGVHAGEAGLLLEPVLTGKADLAIAAFPAPLKKGGFGFVQGLARRGIKRLTGRVVSSPLSGQRAMTGELYRAVAPFERGFGVEVGMTVDALRNRFRVVEIETTMSHRETGRDFEGFMHRGHQFIDVSMALLKRLLAGSG